MLLFRTSMENRAGWRCSGRSWTAGWAADPASPLSPAGFSAVCAAVFAASWEKPTEAQNNAAKQTVTLIIFLRAIELETESRDSDPMRTQAGWPEFAGRLWADAKEFSSPLNPERADEDPC